MHKHLAISNHQYFCKKINSFPCFFRPLFHSTVLKAKSYMLCSKMWFRTPVCAPVGSKMRPLGPKKAPKGAVPQSGAGWFWSDFGLDFKPIWAWFRSNLSYHLWSLISIPKTLLVEVFPRCVCMFHADSWYSIQAYVLVFHKWRIV